MVDNELGLGVVFNGCIYNFRELPAELREKGYRFFSQGDTEVILKAYHAWGPGCVRKFKGMFAFAIWAEPKVEQHIQTRQQVFRDPLNDERLLGISLRSPALALQIRS
jgi:asparagine synthetase B (glutamine-hydrolysing)